MIWRFHSIILEVSDQLAKEAHSPLALQWYLRILHHEQRPAMFLKIGVFDFPPRHFELYTRCA